MNDGNKNYAGAAFVAIVWITLLALAYTTARKSASNFNFNFKFKTEEDLLNGNP